MGNGRVWRGWVLALGLTAAPGLVQAAGDCPLHTVQKGETLRLIAERYLGDRDRAATVYAANSVVIGEDPDRITPGLRLRIPCAGGPDMPDPAAAVAAGAQAAPEDQPVPEEPAAAPDIPAPVILTGGPYRPYVDDAAPGGGMLVELVRAAFAAPEGGGGAEIAVVNDRAAHLDAILPRGGFQLSFPWVYPDCERGALTPEEQILCEGYTGSDILYEQVTEFYARSDSPWAAALQPADIAGARICRPEGYPVADLYEIGLMPGNLELVRAPAPADCLALVDAGGADIASLDASLTRALVARMPLANPLVVLEGLTRIDGLRAVARRGDPPAAAALNRLNAGLNAIAESGEWFEIVDRQLSGTES